MLRAVSRPFMIGVAGGSSSGKTTISERLVDMTGQQHLSRIELDSYYLDRSDQTLEERSQANYDHPDAFDWPLLVRPRQTVVIYMGLSGLPDICAQLVAHGLPAHWPAAVVSQGTLAEQRVVCATLATLAAEVADVERRAIRAALRRADRRSPSWSSGPTASNTSAPAWPSGPNWPTNSHAHRWPAT